MDRKSKELKPGALEQILELARWAPSGDNEQPWQFVIVGNSGVEIYLKPRHSSTVLDPDQSAKRMALGCLLETIRIAATAHGLRVNWNDPPAPDLPYTLTFSPDSTISRDPLVDVITERQTSRGWFKTKRLLPEHKAALEQAVGDDFQVIWLEGRERFRLIHFYVWMEKLRQLTPEMVTLYRNAIGWWQRYSIDRLPSKALGINPLSHAIYYTISKLSALHMPFMRYAGGVWATFFEVGLLPLTFSAGHYVILSKLSQGPTTAVIAGGALQRFWLTAAQLGIMTQPNYMAITIHYYASRNINFSTNPYAESWINKSNQHLEKVWGGREAMDRMVWMARYGYGKKPKSRSLRLPLPLLVSMKAGN